MNQLRKSTALLWAGALVAVSLAAAACGGGGDDDDDDTGGDSAGGRATVPGGGASSSGPGAKKAVVKIGNEEFVFDMSRSCITLGGAVGGGGNTSDGKVALSITIPPENWQSSRDDWDAPHLRIDDERTEPMKQWESGTDTVSEIPAFKDKARVDSFKVDGNRATGTASFVDVWRWQLSLGGSAPAPELVTGTFDIQC